MSKERILPKSLHTITVLEQLARHLMSDVDPDTAALFGPEASRSAAMKAALRILKLDAMPDSYGLAAAALAKIERNPA